MFGNRIRKSMLRNRYLITMLDGDAFAGVIDDDDGKSIILQQVIAYDRDGEHVVDHRMILFASRIAYIQELRA